MNILSREDLKPLRPFLSVFLIVISLFVVVFAKMEERRLGYAVLKLTREQRKAVADQRAKMVHLAKLTRPELVEKMAQNRLTLKKVQTDQIIHLPGSSELNHRATVPSKGL